MLIEEEYFDCLEEWGDEFIVKMGVEVIKDLLVLMDLFVEVE